MYKRQNLRLTAVYLNDVQVEILIDRHLFQASSVERLSLIHISLPLLNQAFEKQYDQLLAGELMDTQVEIDVLKAALGPELLPKEGTK